MYETYSLNQVLMNYFGFSEAKYDKYMQEKNDEYKAPPEEKYRKSEPENKASGFE